MMHPQLKFWATLSNKETCNTARKMNFEDVCPSVENLWLKGILNPMVGMGKIDFAISGQN